mmetsp:Transcript_49967/g.154416  ORF Transcript_49967/g.154416 Transcript_49967/m.154416 type:complete len:250 (+) Transcript_49967:27-776(+)
MHRPCVPERDFRRGARPPTGSSGHHGQLLGRYGQVALLFLHLVHEGGELLALFQLGRDLVLPRGRDERREDAVVRGGEFVTEQERALRELDGGLKVGEPLCHALRRLGHAVREHVGCVEAELHGLHVRGDVRRPQLKLLPQRRANDRDLGDLGSAWGDDHGRREGGGRPFVWGLALVGGSALLEDHHGGKTPPQELLHRSMVDESVRPRAGGGLGFALRGGRWDSRQRGLQLFALLGGQPLHCHRELIG